MVVCPLTDFFDFLEAFFDFLDADQAGGIFGCEYEIRYRTNVDDLSQ
mgnify:CR=1 FL=1